jgi:hypothetical protein
MSSDEFIAARRWVRRSTSEFGHDRSLTQPGRVLRFRAARRLDNRWPPINNGTEGNRAR